jgi:adenine-specific DNA methylase
MNNKLTEKYIENNFPIEAISLLAIKEGNSKRPIYHLHKWWARRLTSIVRGLLIGSSLPKTATENDFWERFYGKSTLDELTIMDIFMGGGSSLVEAKKMGAKTIGIDIDPMACFITSKELQTVDLNELEKTFKDLEQKVSTQIKHLYRTVVNGHEKAVINNFWVYRVDCPNCSYEFQAHPHYQIYHTKNEQGIVCKHCGNINIESIKLNISDCTQCNEQTIIKDGNLNRGICTCPQCKSLFPLRERIKGNESLQLFAIEYQEQNKKVYKQADEFDFNLYKEAEQKFIAEENNIPLPNEKISIENEKDKRPLSHGYIYYKDLFNKRQLYALGLILREIAKIEDTTMKEWMLIAFSDSLASNNMLCNYAYGYQKLTPLFGIHAYSVPSRPVENNVWGTGGFGRGSFEKIFQKMIRSKQYCIKPFETKIDNNKTKKIFTTENIYSSVTNDPNQFYANKADSLILNQSSTDLNQIHNKSIDLILTDPPYYDNLHYSHLADFYYQWIKSFIHSNETCPLTQSLFAQNDNEETYVLFTSKLKAIFHQAYLKLKDDGMMVFSYHHNKENAWKAIAEALKENNFYISNIFPVRSEGQSAYHSNTQTIKWDSILVIRKKESIQKKCSMPLEQLFKIWKDRINEQNLVMNENDKLSFFRSLAVLDYVNTETNIENIFSILK